jgi:hypothetical protein
MSLAHPGQQGGERERIIGKRDGKEEKKVAKICFTKGHLNT